MPLNDEQVWELKRIRGDCIHASNILAKKGDKDIGQFFSPYMEFHRASLSSDMAEAVAGLNCYKTFVHKNSEYPAQSKFESTIVEEFICQMLRPRFGNGVLKYGPVKAYSSLYFSYAGKNAFKAGADIRVNEKDQDIGIYKSETLKISDGEFRTIHIPMVCIECKTYLDKTMYEGSVATADKIKTGNPHCLFFIVTETYEISKDIEVETSNIDNIYVLRKQRRRTDEGQNPIYADVFEHLLKTIKEKLDTERLPVDDMIEQHGYVRR